MVVKKTSAPLLKRLKNRIIALSAFIALGCALPAGIWADTVGESDPSVIRDYRTGVIAGLKTIPQLQRSKIEIELKHLDEDDSRWSYVPTIELAGYYYFSADEATISFHAANYRPWEPYYSLQAREMITDIAMLKHAEAISLAAKKIAESYLKLLVQQRLADQYLQMEQLAEKKKRFVEIKSEISASSPLDMAIAQRTRQQLKARTEAALLRAQAIEDGLVIGLNLPENSTFDLERIVVLEQILGQDWVKGLARLTQPENSFQYQIHQKMELLQEKKILLAYSKYMPDLLLGVRTPDALSLSSQEDIDYFFYIGVGVTLWDGQKRSRDITRQELLLRQLKYDTRAFENDESLKWLEAVQNYTVAVLEVQTSADLLELNKARLKKLGYDLETGNVSPQDYFDSQMRGHQKSIEHILKEHKMFKAGLELRHLSGQLLTDTVNISFSDYRDD